MSLPEVLFSTDILFFFSFWLILFGFNLVLGKEAGVLNRYILQIDSKSYLTSFFLFLCTKILVCMFFLSSRTSLQYGTFKVFLLLINFLGLFFFFFFQGSSNYCLHFMETYYFYFLNEVFFALVTCACSKYSTTFYFLDISISLCPALVLI